MFEDKLAIALYVVIVEDAITPLSKQFAKARLAIIKSRPEVRPRSAVKSWRGLLLIEFVRTRLPFSDLL